jgi:hypothetical protein
MTVTSAPAKHNERSKMVDNDKASQYKRAAEAALDQLDWCIRYLRGARKNDVARAVSRNRDHIRRRLQGRPPSEIDRER